MKRAVAFLISLAFLSFIFYKIDIDEFIENFRNIDPLYISIAMFLFIPQFLVIAKRWQIIIEDHARITLWTSFWLPLTASTLNMVLPSKLGDFAKTVYHRNNNGLDLKKGVFLTVIEKSYDFTALCLVLLGGALFITDKTTIVYGSMIFSLGIIGAVLAMFFIDIKKIGFITLMDRFKLGHRVSDFIVKWDESIISQKSDKIRLARVAALSLTLWILHMGQIYFFFLALRSDTPASYIFALTPISILVGLLPVSFAGIGTRDAALIYLFAPFEPASLMASVGLLCTLRYFIPAMFGLPFMHKLGVKASELEEVKSKEAGTHASHHEQ